MRASSRHGLKAGERTCSGTSTTRSSNPWLRADSGDGKALRCDRRRQHAVRITLAVEVLRVDERGPAREPEHVAKEIGDGNREAQIDERFRDLAVTNAEGPVARHAGDHTLSRVNDPEIVQTRDVETVAD